MATMLRLVGNHPQRNDESGALPAPAAHDCALETLFESLDRLAALPKMRPSLSAACDAEMNDLEAFARHIRLQIHKRGAEAALNYLPRLQERLFAIQERIPQFSPQDARICRYLCGDAPRQDYFAALAPLEDALELLLPALAARNISALRAFSQDMPRLFGDYGRLRQSLMALLCNAMEALSGIQGNLIIAAESHYSDTGEPIGVHISISDMGAGISRADFPHILEPLFSRKPAAEHLGMGLTLAHRVISEMDGNLEIKTRLHKGATVLVRLPARTAQERPLIATNSASLPVTPLRLVA